MCRVKVFLEIAAFKNQLTMLLQVNLTALDLAVVVLFKHGISKTFN